MNQSSLKQMYHSQVAMNNKLYDFRVWKVVHPNNIMSIKDNYRLTIMSKDRKEWAEISFSTYKRLNAYLHNIMTPYRIKKAA